MIQADARHSNDLSMINVWVFQKRSYFTIEHDEHDEHDEGFSMGTIGASK